MAQTMHGGLNMKGTGLLPVVSAFRAERPILEPLLPEHLRHYIDEDVNVAGWYPVEDVFEMMRVMAKGLMPQVSTQRAFEYFGAVAAERDLQGKQDLVRETHRVVAGFYEGAISKKHDLATTVRRACGLTQLYYDAGELVARRIGERTLSLRLVGQPFIGEEPCHVTRGYFLQILRMVGIHSGFEKVSCRARGDAQCEWHFVVPEGIDVASLKAFES